MRRTRCNSSWVLERFTRLGIVNDGDAEIDLDAPKARSTTLLEGHPTRGVLRYARGSCMLFVDGGLSGMRRVLGNSFPFHE